MGSALEDRFRDLEGFSTRHSRQDRGRIAAAIALGHKDIAAYDRIQAHLEGPEDRP